MQAAREEQYHAELRVYEQRQRLHQAQLLTARMDVLWTGVPCQVQQLERPQRLQRTILDVLQDTPRSVPC